MRTRTGSAQVRRRLAGHRRPRRPPAGVLAVDADRRSTAVLLGLTLLALLVGATTVVLGVTVWAAPGAFDAPGQASPGLVAPPPPQPFVEGSAACGSSTAQGTWSVPDGTPPQSLRVAVLSPDGAALASGPVATDGGWSLPLPDGLPGTGAVVLLGEGQGPLASSPLPGC